MIKVSIIIPIYNVAGYLPNSLDSFITTLPEDCEVILVNDGSTDNSLQVCEEYVSKFQEVIEGLRFQVINKTNGGLSDARNAGTVVAKAEYIYYLDSDDWITPNAIQKLYEFATEHKCEVVQGGFYYAYNKYLLYDNRWFEDTDVPFVLNREEAMHQLILNNYVKNFAWGKLYRANIVKKYPFPKGKYFEDSYWQHLVMNEVTRYGVMPEPMYYYRQRESGISGEFSIRNLDLLEGNRERLRFIEKNYPKLLPVMNSFYKKLCISSNECAIRTKNEDIIKAYSEYLQKEGIKYNRTTYRTINFAKRVWNHIFAKRLKRIDF